MAAVDRDMGLIRHAYAGDLNKICDTCGWPFTDPVHDCTQIMSDLTDSQKLDVIMESLAWIEEVKELLNEFRPVLEQARAKLARKEQIKGAFGARR